MPCHVWLGLTLMVLLITGARCLKNVRLDVIPEAVERGHEAILQCSYDLEQAPLYSVKWYRGSFEFYRFSPNETPRTRKFNFTWINVDINNSSESQVMIRNVDFPLSGNFSCEVTTDAPTFLTASSSKTLTVVSIPKSKPVVLSEHTRYEPGEILNANCSTASSKPPARLTFTLNDVQVGPEMIPKQIQEKHEYNSISNERVVDFRQLTELSLHLQPFHYVNGQLNLRCTAKIPGIYEQTSDAVQLGSALREPVPERVTSENASDKCHRIGGLTILGLVMLHLHFR